MCSKLDRSNKLSNKTNDVMCNKSTNKLQTRNQAMCNKFDKSNNLQIGQIRQI